VELARTARAAVAFADFTTPAAEVRGRGLVEVAVPEDAPLNREWAVVCDAPDLPACLVAVERPGQHRGPDAERTFEAIWTVDPQIVRQAGRVAIGLADGYRPGWRPDGLTLPDEDPPGASRDLQRASDLFNRMIGYLDRSR